MKTNTKHLAAALRILANDIESPDGVANAAILEAAERLEELMAQVDRMQKRIAELEREKAELLVYVHDAEKWFNNHDPHGYVSPKREAAKKHLNQIKAESYKAGFIAGADSYFDRHYDKSVSDEVLLSADKYANRIRKGGE
jgi:predicted ATP-grasp superfamily ATP-dependent carboligase